jgi:hypothetical protein
MSVTVSNPIETRNVRKSQKFFQKFQQQIELASTNGSIDTDTNRNNQAIPSKIASARQQPPNPKTAFSKSQSFTASLNTAANANTGPIAKIPNETNTIAKLQRFNSNLTNTSLKTTQSDTQKASKSKGDKSSKPSITNMDDAEPKSERTNLQTQRQHLLKKQQNLKIGTLQSDKSQANRSSLPVFSKKNMKQSVSIPSVSYLSKPHQLETQNSIEAKPILSKSLINKIEIAKQKSHNQHSQANGMRNKITEEVSLSADNIPNAVATSQMKRPNKIPVYINPKYTSLIRQKQQEKLHTSIPE